MINVKTEKTAMTFASLTLVFLSLFPVIMIFKICFFKENQLIENAIAIIVYVCLGYIMGYVVRPQNILKKNMILCGSIVTIVVIQMLINLNVSFEYSFFQICSVLIFFIIGTRVSLSRLNPPISITARRIGMIFLLIALITTYYYPSAAYLKDTFLICSYVYMIIYVIIESQENLSSIFNDRGIQTSEVQKKIRISNIKMIVAFFLLIIFLFNLKSIILFLLHNTKQLVYQFLWLIAHILQLLWNEQQIPDTPGPKPVPPFLSDLNSSGNNLLDYIFYTIFFITIIYTIYKLTPALIKKVKQGIVFIINILRILLKYPIMNNIDNAEECFDHIEITKFSRPELKKRRVKEPKRLNRLATLKQTKDPVEKIRLLYGIILERLDRNVPINKSDTTGEIYRKSLEICESTVSFNEMTKIYDKVRYGEKFPGNDDILEMENNYSIMSTDLKKKRK